MPAKRTFHVVRVGTGIEPATGAAVKSVAYDGAEVRVKP
jgi:hypothetical protein